MAKLRIRRATPEDLMNVASIVLDSFVSEINGHINTIHWGGSATYFGVTGIGVAGGSTDIDSATGGRVESVVGGFPDEYEYIVVLYAAIKAAQSLLASEEDDDLYVPMINTLKSDYMLGLQAMGSKLEGQKQKKETDSNRQMKALLSQMLEYGKQ